MEAEERVTVAEAAAELGLSVRRVRDIIASGSLPAEKSGREWSILRTDIDKVRDRKPGRPRKIKWARRKAR